ncbi:hypothetical protein [Streptacidiphilus jiangxiensis]|uniref:Uncharacterized protein n=1 Tax=Streptacidiphilus jiangxiensis TaxID=235985 RepID=A0A1H7H1M3_STRJI|nr:hypothetical protein [Streptacidiphilus jiangxiensis]SEK44214.1 hypothetical protein SAMN05414137_10241 [Streptacidiphilus jiangxiensis]
MDQLRRTAAPRPAPDSPAVPSHLAPTLRVYIPGVAWLRLHSLQVLGRGCALSWIAADHPDAVWDADLALDLATGRLHPWLETDFAAAGTAEVV